MITSNAEIKIAVIGQVAVGKTTVLNALFREKYSEVSMLRTTAGVNYFRVSHGLAENGEADWPTTMAEPADSTLNEITQDNVKFRESDEIHEKHFDIALKGDPICQMRPDTKLVYVDIPGINEAGSGSKYKDYVAEKWSTFDCVILVMDGRQGVNTEEQVEQLKFVKSLQQEQKDLPVIILCNKVDDPEEEEQRLLVAEARKEVESVFGVSDRDEALNTLLQAAKLNIRAFDNDQIYPCFIATSAIHAFIYQAVSLLEMDEFKNKFDNGLVEKFGREEVGRWKWNRLSAEERYETTYEVLRDQAQYQERLESTQFDKFLAALAYTVGDSDNQLRLIKKQFSVSLERLAPKSGIALEVRALHEKSQILGETTNEITDKFWKIYDDFEDKAFEDLKRPSDVDCLAKPMAELAEFYELVRQVNRDDQKEKTGRRMKTLIRRQLAVVFKEERFSRDLEWNHDNVEIRDDPTWPMLSPEDWKLICRSILLFSFNEHFCLDFGQEKMWLESLMDKINRTAHCYLCGNDRGGTHHSCSYQNAEDILEMKMVAGELVPVQEERFAKIFCVEVPDSPSNPSHWGHLTWKYCQLKKSGV